jgi:hypothetical protein
MANNIVSKSWTYSLSIGTITIDESYNLNILSILATSGSVTITGGRAANGIAPAPITLAEGQAVTISSGNDNTLPISDIIITTAGTASLIGR